jgi:HemY protein
LRTALRANEQAGRWDEVLSILRLVEKRDALHPAATLQLRIKAVESLLAEKSGDAAAIALIWRGLKADERAIPGVASRVASALSAADADQEARNILETALDVDFDESMLQTYGALDHVPTRNRLDRLEGWRQRYGDQPLLLLTLGRVCAAERLWGKAEEYLVLAVRREPSVTTHVALAELFESLGRTQEAAQQYRAAAQLARS